jgi:hypothetical protein
LYFGGPFKGCLFLELKNSYLSNTMTEILQNAEYERILFSRLGASGVHVHRYIDIYTVIGGEKIVFIIAVFSRIYVYVMCMRKQYS